MQKAARLIHLMILDDHDMFREGLARTLWREPDMRVVAQCGTPREALALLDRGITMVLLDADLGDERALGFVEEARREIGANLEISDSAVKACLHAPFEKVKVRSRTQLVKVALEHYQNEL